MNERLSIISFDSGEVGVTLGATFLYFEALTDMTIVGMSCAPSADDADATITLNDDDTATECVATCADQDDPGTWKSAHLGGTADPIFIAAGSLCSFTAAGTAANTRISGQVYALMGSI